MYIKKTRMESLKVQLLKWKVHYQGSAVDWSRSKRTSEGKDVSSEIVLLGTRKKKEGRKINRASGTIRYANRYTMGRTLLMKGKVKRGRKNI